MILEDDESDAALGLSKSTDTSGHELWYDVEDQRFVDKDLCPFPPLEQEGLASTPTPTQDQSQSCHHSARLSQDQISQHGNDRTMPSASEEPTPYTLPASLSKNSEGESEEENVSELEKDLLPAFEEQDKLLSAPAPALSSPRFWHHSVEPSHPQIDGAGTIRLEELRHGSPLRSQDREEEPQEQQQRQEVAAEAMREDDDDKEPEQRGEKRHHRGANEETSSNIHHPEESDHSHKTNEKDAEDDEDDEDPRPAKRRKLPPISTRPAPRLGRLHSLTPSSTTQPEIDESPSQADHAHPPTPVDNDHHNTPQTSCSPSTAESTPVAEYQEWPFQGFLKCTTIGNRTIYNLEFTLPRTCEHPRLSLHSEVLGSARELLAKAAVSHRVVSKRKPGKELTTEQESLLAKMVQEDETWADIGRHFPGHTLQSLKENFFMKQGGQPRKRGRKAGVRASRYIYEDETSFV